MGILDALEKMLVGRRAPAEQIHLKEIVSKGRCKTSVESVKTSAVGTGYTNPDGSSRQDALQKLKAGDKVRLIWKDDGPENKAIVYLVRKGRSKEVAMSDCFGRLNDRVAAEVVRRLTLENVVTEAKVMKITGGTPKHPKRGCVIELTGYPGPSPNK